MASYSQSFTSANQTNDGITSELLRYPQSGQPWTQTSAFSPGRNMAGAFFLGLGAWGLPSGRIRKRVKTHTKLTDCHRISCILSGENGMYATIPGG